MNEYPEWLAEHLDPDWIYYNDGQSDPVLLRKSTVDRICKEVSTWQEFWDKFPITDIKDVKI